MGVATTVADRVEVVELADELDDLCLLGTAGEQVVPEALEEVEQLVEVVSEDRVGSSALSASSATCRVMKNAG
ncbi:hypothetical protein [Nocardia sp. NPDC023988]|uniref:hypothetical protein n=1 Tax=unclassified Nocardia TaxID=2637762 RepID=UPI0033C1731D